LNELRDSANEGLFLRVGIFRGLTKQEKAADID